MVVTQRRGYLVTTLCIALAAACSTGSRDAHEREPRSKDAGRESPRRDAGGAEPDDRDDAGARGDAGGRGQTATPDAGPPQPPRIEDLLTPNPQATYGIETDPPHPVFDQGAVREYRVEVDPDDWAHINETAYLEEYIPARLTYQGQVFEKVALRFKGFRGSLYNCFRFDRDGNATARTCDKLSLKLSFDEYDDDARFFGLKKLNFHAMNNDLSRLRERLAYFLFRRFGVPAPRAVHATLVVNGQPLGLYTLVEQVDGRFTRARFPDGGEGNLYKERWPTSSTEEDYFRSGLESNTGEPKADVGAMVRFSQQVLGADETTIENVLRRHTDFPELMRYLAVDRAIQLWDGITAFRCQPESEVPPLPPEVREAQTPPLGWETCQNKNFYFYEASTHDRIWLVAWDTDVSFAGVPSPFPQWDEPPEACEVRQSGRAPMCDPLIAYFATTLRPHYVSAGKAFLDTVFKAEVVGPVLRAWSLQIQPYLGFGDIFAIAPEPLLDRVTQVHEDFEEELAR